MAAFDDMVASLRGFSGRVRLFPLPNLVLFPHVMQPLHVFEPRYRELLEDALAGDRLLAMAVLGPGWEMNYEGRPSLYAMTCLGHITTHVRLPDGTYNVLVLGLQRARLVREMKPTRLFREAEVVLCEDHYPERASAAPRALHRRLREALARLLPQLPEAEEQVDQLLGEDVPLGVLTDLISYMLKVDLGQKQLLLSEVDVCRRAELLLAHLTRIAAHACCDAQAFCFPPQFSAN